MIDSQWSNSIKTVVPKVFDSMSSLFVCFCLGNLIRFAHSIFLKKFSCLFWLSAVRRCFIEPTFQVAFLFHYILLSVSRSFHRCESSLPLCRNRSCLSWLFVPSLYIRAFALAFCLIAPSSSAWSHLLLPLKRTFLKLLRFVVLSTWAFLLLRLGHCVLWCLVVASLLVDSSLLSSTRTCVSTRILSMLYRSFVK